jgi:hypothetical protein
MTETTTLYCYVHPARETSLRCNRCERPICAQCAVRTPTGYRCKECVRQQQKTFDTAVWSDYLIGFALTSLLSLLASSIIAALSAFIGFFMFFLAAGIAYAGGRIIADLLLRVLRRRSRALFWVVGASVVIGALPAVAFLLFTFNFYALISLGIFVVVAAPTVYSRFSGIQL